MKKALGSKVLHIRGNDIYYEQHLHSRTAATIVLIHGFLSSSFSYRTLIPLLCKDFNVISIDFPPFGQSGKSRRFHYSYQNISLTLLAFLDAIDIKKCILVGHSMGGQICLYMLKNRPELSDKAILLCSSGYLPKSGRLLRFASFIPYFPRVVKRWLEKSGVEANLQNVVYNRQLIDDEMRQGYLRPFLNDDIFKALARMVRDREGDLSEKDLHSLETKFLLLWGKHDRVVPLSVGRRLHADLKNSELIVLDEAGHLLPEEKPELVYSYVKEFIESNDPLVQKLIPVKSAGKTTFQLQN
ncbi:alpha/beta fold hydrolase [Bacillus sp. V5-8f]|uniref:alpha/beta fold hydrolase n=1 Tax=Bacillus sp. V5-8f TaxID=2053044 RepID=UPI000C75C18E|nr:alpha/beta hydrolase [Bacillus sp. V5-8f]PLT34034.1 alpha/beta hydrolase [Bacillus sp. V5-8f]